MAMRRGIEEPRIQTWFEKQRTLNPDHRQEPMSVLGVGANEGPPPAARWPHFHPVTPQVNYLPSSNPCWCDHTSLPAPLRSQAFVPWDSFEVFGSQAPSAMIMQAPEAVQRNLDTLHSPEQPVIARQDFSAVQAPSYSLPDAEHEKRHSEDPDSINNISYIMQWWDKGRLDLIARWNPLKET